MKRFSKKGVVLFAGAMAVCAFVMPSTASAASWGPTGTHTVLHSTDIGFTSSSSLYGTAVSSCTRSSLTTNVASATNLNISTASFGGHCVWRFPDIQATCTVTAAATSLPWRATAVTTSNIQIHNFRLDLTFENTPGSNGCGPITNSSGVITGTLAGGQWSGNAVGQRSVTFMNGTGLTAHLNIAGFPVIVAAAARGSIAATGALTVS